MNFCLIIHLNGLDCDVAVTRYDFQEMSFYEQIKLARETDILLGTHGAALTTVLYMIPQSKLIEIGHPTRHANYHFQNIASFVGVEYAWFDGDDQLSSSHLENILNGVKKSVDWIRKQRNQSSV